ncbi:MAG: hypothetical protein MJ124_09205 [Lachnospiraceae bacterium]|nr:hypothetical protein [Lachnospiraceae bacterium]
MGMRPDAADSRLQGEVEKAEKNFLKTVEGHICWEIYNKEDISTEEVKIGDYYFKSISLKKHLEGCKKIIAMAATLGAEADRLRIRAAAVSQLNELIYDALGTEGIESVCDQFCNEVGRKYGNLTPRFSPGYGDLALEYQKDMIMMLDTQKRIGVTLLDSLLMTPTKSVTAFVGIKE